MKIYKFELIQSYASGVALVLADNRKEAQYLLKKEVYSDGNWEFNGVVEHLSSTLDKPQIILINSYIE